MKNNENIGILGKYFGKSYGGKSDNLNFLYKKGFNIPKGFCLQNLITEDEINNIYSKYINSSYYIVRSSSNCEDNDKLSYAGLFKSIEGKYKNGKLAEDLKEVFYSINNPFLDIYEKKILGKIRKNRKMNVLVQEYIVGNYSGVYFSNMEGKRVLSFIRGGNKLLVDGRVNGTNIYMDKKFNILKQEYNIQEQVLNSDFKEEYYNGIVKLKKNLFISLIKEFYRIEKLFNYEVDIEWTIKDNRIYILQVRPITI